MDKSEFIKYLDDLFKSHSFKKRGNQWSFSNDEIIKIIRLSKSRYGNFYYIYYGPESVTAAHQKHRKT